MDLGTTSTQLIATAFTFGLAALAFTHFPFIFTLVNGLLKANSGHNSHSSSVLSVFAMAFAVHSIACVLFMIGVKMLDVLGSLYQGNYLQEKIFPIFWARGQSTIFGLANSSGGMEDEGAYLQLYIVQTITDWVMLLGFWIVFATATSYAVIQTKKDVSQFNLVSFAVWFVVANVIGYFIYFLWAQIATLGFFIPNGETLTEKIISVYKNLIDRGTI